MTPRVYLAGPMQDKTDQECHEWRDAATIALGLVGVEAVSPMVRDYREVTNLDPAEVVCPDLRDIQGCEGMLVEARLGASWGTAQELVYAFLLNKPAVAIVEPDTMVSYWLLYHTKGRIAYSVADAVNLLVPLLQE